MGRGKRERRRPELLADAETRVRLVPAGLGAALKAQPDPFDLRALNRLRAVFLDGYTDDDVKRISARLALALGSQEHRLCVVWDGVDEHGCHGDSEMFIRRGDTLYALPPLLADLLYEGRPLDADEARAVVADVERHVAAESVGELLAYDDWNLARRQDSLFPF